MPLIMPKKTAATEILVWDAFPPPPRDAEFWQPDPGSIARPGGLPDPRFNRDPEQDQSSSHVLTPAWAVSLEKAIAEDDKKLDALAATTISPKFISRPETIRKKSIPPHLRGKIGDEDKAPSAVSFLQHSHLNLNPNTKVFEGLAMHGDSEEALAPTIRPHLDHDVKVKVMLTRAMEHEMDLDKVAPERKLIAMQRAELDRYHDKVYSAHQQWWEAMQKV